MGGCLVLCLYGLACSRVLNADFSSRCLRIERISFELMFSFVFPSSKAFVIPFIAVSNFIPLSVWAWGSKKISVWRTDCFLIFSK